MTLKTVETTRIGTFFRGHVLILYGHVLGQGWDMLCPVLAVFPAYPASPQRPTRAPSKDPPACDLPALVPALSFPPKL